MDTTISKATFAMLGFLLLIYVITAANSDAKQQSYGTVLMAKFTENPYDPPAAVGADYID
jgi:hypothetical protein